MEPIIVLTHAIENRLPPPRNWLRAAAWAAVAALCLLRFCFLSADFPNNSPWDSDQAKYTDEGWWASAAVSQHLLGHWYVPGDYNPAVALPVWPLLLHSVFSVSGVGVLAARALSVALSVATLGLVFVLTRRFAGNRPERAALLAVLLAAASPFAFAFSRLAILESPVSFEFCLILLIASGDGGIAAMAILPLLVAAMLLTKTTAAILLPAVLWMVWHLAVKRIRSKPLSLLLALALTVLIPAALWKAYVALVLHSAYADDYRYFFEWNAMDIMDWTHSPAIVLNLLRNCFWVDRVLYPLGLCVLAWSVGWRRTLWRNPLYTASWLALAAQAAFIFRRQDDFAPRYFLWMLIPLVLAVVLALDDLPDGVAAPRTIGGIALATALLLNVCTIGSFVIHRTYQFADAASSIQRIVESGKPVGKRQPPAIQIVGVSGSQLSLMTGIPAISDGYGTAEIPDKLARYRPQWYVAWNNAIDATTQSLFDLQPVATYPVFDDPDRNRLILYRMIPKPVPKPMPK